ncbi:MAG TPA: hypothetical protein VIL37_11100 [Natronosporangium sp.]
MTSRLRVTGRRLTLAAAAAALVGVPLLGGSSATAESAGTVTFTGGCGVLGSGLGGSATPDIGQLSVPAGTGVRFTNRLGQNATLRLDGEPAAEVPAGGTADVVFHDGPVTASMQINCLLGTPAGTVEVEVQQVPPPAEPSERPDPGDRDDRTTPPSQDGGTSGDETGAGAPAGEPPWVPGPPTGDQAASLPPPASGPAAAADRGDRADAEQPRPWGVQVEPPSGSASTGQPEADDQESGDLAVDQMSRTSSATSDEGPIGLLALIATVCVVGVSAGAVRALISQRAHRTEWA